MRRAGAGDQPVPAGEVAIWARLFLVQLYSPQQHVRYEVRKKYTVEPWIQAETIDVLKANRRGLEVLALYLHPKAEKPLKQHRFDAGRCHDGGKPPAPTPESRAAALFDPAWFREPLEALKRFCTTRDIGQWDAQKWKRETTYLLERLDQYDKEALA